MIVLPDKCLRGLKTCTPISQIESDGGDSFICMGCNSPHTRTINQDKYSLCWKNNVIDEHSHFDYRDITDTVSILAQGLSVIENARCSGEKIAP